MNPETSPEIELTAFLLRAIDRALDGVTIRQKTIIRRCYLGGERFTDVAEALGISERHAFRERNAALPAILANLATGSIGRVNRVDAAEDDMWLRIRQARAIQANGNWEAASTVLDCLATALADDAKRILVETTLARLYVSVDRFSLAQSRLDAARQIYARSEKAKSWQRAEIDLIEARLADTVGETGRAEQLARRASADLHDAMQTDGDRRIPNALVEALTVRAEVAFRSGERRRSVELSSAAVELCAQIPTVERPTALAARTVLGIASWTHTGDWRESERRVLDCYSEATGAGLTRDAIGIAVQLAGCLRVVRHPKRHLTALLPLVAVARSVGTGMPLSLLMYELARASLACGDVKASGEYLAEMQANTQGDPRREAHAQMVAARVSLARGEYAAALRCAEYAESAFVRLRDSRYVGASLQLQAEASAQLRQRRRIVTLSTPRSSRQRFLPES